MGGLWDCGINARHFHERTPKSSPSKGYKFKVSGRIRVKDHALMVSTKASTQERIKQVGNLLKMFKNSVNGVFRILRVANHRKSPSSMS